jgi:predicted ATPase/class 3 adenylate cyclase
MATLPTGTVTFLFTDIEGSTMLLQRLGDRRYADVIAEHRRVLRAAFAEGNGQEVDTQGDAFLVAFARAKDAVATAVAAQRVLINHAWPGGASLRVRMGLHTGEPVSEAGGYVGVDVHRASRICSVGHGGQILVSDATHALVAEDHPDEVSLRDLGEHVLKDLARPHRLFQVTAPDLPTIFPPLKSLNVFPNNLPAQLTSFIGREREIEEVKRMLATFRLLTLTGAGGFGKTRLALQVGADVLEQYSGGVWMVELAALGDPALLPQTVAHVLGIPEQPGQPLTETLIDSLRPKSLLLILDNCEHLLAACPRLADVLLRACPDVRILATSREGLGIAGEALYPVPTLSVPAPEPAAPTDDLARYAAVRLFAERAMAVVPAFRVTPQNAKSVVQICGHLDGIPLAIELAAVRVKTLAVDQILARLGDRFRLLTRGSRVAPPRHQTLQAAMDWSYDLLGERERAALRRLSAFAGHCTLEAAEAVCGGDGVEAADVLDVLTQLVNKSLVIVEEQRGEARYRLLETVRQYARDRLLESGDAGAVQTRHQSFFLALAEETEPRLLGPEEVALLDRLEDEHDNLRAVLARSLEACDSEAGLRLAGALGWFWYRQGYWAEGREWLTRALSAGRRAGPASRAKAFSAAATLIFAQGDLDSAMVLGQQALALHAGLGDKKGAAIAHYILGTTSLLKDDRGQAEGSLEESLRLFREAGDRWGAASALRFLATLATARGEYAQAGGMAEESLRLYREAGYKRGAGYALLSLGRLAYVERDYGRAAALFEEGHSTLRELRDREGIAIAAQYLADLARKTGDRRRAITLYRESLKTHSDMGNRRFLAQPLEGLALMSASTRNARGAATLLGAAEALREATSIGRRFAFFDISDEVSKLRTALDGVEVAAARAEGKAMTLEQAIEYALSMPDAGVT